MRLRRTPGIKSSSGRSETGPHADWLSRSRDRQSIGRGSWGPDGLVWTSNSTPKTISSSRSSRVPPSIVT